MTYEGAIGSSGINTNLKTPQSIGITLGANDKPSGTVNLADIASGGAYWTNKNKSSNRDIDVFLCDSAGNNAYKLFTVSCPKDSSTTVPKSATIDAPNLKGKALYIKATGGGADDVRLRNRTRVFVDTVPVNFSITCQVSPANCGTLTASTYSTAPGNVVTLNATPAQGYRFVRFTSSPALTISGSSFTMPGQSVVVTAVFERIVYAVTTRVNNANGGTLTADKATAGPGDSVLLTPKAKAGYKFDGYTTSPSVTITNNAFTMPGQAVTITANFSLITYGITCKVTPEGAGTLSASKTIAAPGETITLTPVSSTGWRLKSYTTSPAVTVGDNKFSMPGQAITVTATFEKVGYTITKVVTPEGAGNIIVDEVSANMGDRIAFDQAPATGFYFNGWSFNPAVTVEDGEFIMPAANVTITASYLKRSTGTLGSTSMTGGGQTTLTITAEKNTYTHKYKLSFGTGMETNLESVVAGVSSVLINIPENWSDQIPSQVSKTGGSLLLETYNGDDKIGEYTITGLTYNVPEGFVPAISDILTDIVRTVAGQTFSNVGEYYVQNHCAARIRATGAGSHASQIENMTVAVGGYTGGSFVKTFAAAAVDFTTGILSIAGNTVITVTATDSRGRTTTKTASITVTQYNAPAGSLSAWRCDVDGETDPDGIYAKYEITKRFSEIGTNSLTATLESNGSTATLANDSGDILPGGRQVFNIQQEYRIKLTLRDAFEETVITVTLSSARFLIYVNKDGNKIGIMKATTKPIPAGKNSTVEFSDDSQIYIGDETLEEFIQRIAGS